MDHASKKEHGGYSEDQHAQFQTVQSVEADGSE